MPAAAPGRVGRPWRAASWQTLRKVYWQIVVGLAALPNGSQGVLPAERSDSAGSATSSEG